MKIAFIDREGLATSFVELLEIDQIIGRGEAVAIFNDSQLKSLLQDPSMYDIILLDQTLPWSKMYAHQVADFIKKHSPEVILIGISVDLGFKQKSYNKVTAGDGEMVSLYDYILKKDVYDKFIPKLKVIIDQYR